MMIRNRDILVSVVIKMWAGWQENRFPIHSKCRDFSSPRSNLFWAHQASHPMGMGCPFPESKEKPATHLHLVLRVGMHGAIPPLLCTFSWRGVQLTPRKTLRLT